MKLFMTSLGFDMSSVELARGEEKSVDKFRNRDSQYCFMLCFFVLAFTCGKHTIFLSIYIFKVLMAGSVTWRSRCSRRTLWATLPRRSWGPPWALDR